MLKELLLTAGLAVGAAHAAPPADAAAPEHDQAAKAKVVVQDVLTDTDTTAINCGCGGGNCSC